MNDSNRSINAVSLIMLAALTTVAVLTASAIWFTFFGTVTAVVMY